jgi:hypothetical protein
MQRDGVVVVRDMGERKERGRGRGERGWEMEIQI